MNRLELFEKMKLAVEQEYQSYLRCREIAERSADQEMQHLFDKIAREKMEQRDQIMRQYCKLAPSAD